MADKLIIKIGDWEKEIFNKYYYNYNTATTFEEALNEWLHYESDFDGCSSCDQLRVVDKWIEYDQYYFYEYIKNHFEYETEVEEHIIRDWLKELVDQEMQNTCAYDDKLDGYDVTDEIMYLYEVVENLCDLVEEEMLNYFVKNKLFTSYILHLKKSMIDDDRMNSIHCKVNTIMRQSDHHSLIELLVKLINNPSDKIYFKLI